MNHVFKIIIIIIITIKRIKSKRKVKRGVGENENEREIFLLFFFFFSFLFKIYGNLTISFRWSIKQSRSTHREPHVGTKILAFCQIP